LFLIQLGKIKVICVRAVDIDDSQVVESTLLELIEIIKVGIKRVAAENHRRRTFNIVS